MVWFYGSLYNQIIRPDLFNYFWSSCGRPQQYLDIWKTKNKNPCSQGQVPISNEKKQPFSVIVWVFEWQTFHYLEGDRNWSESRLSFLSPLLTGKSCWRWKRCGLFSTEKRNISPSLFPLHSHKIITHSPHGWSSLWLHCTGNKVLCATIQRVWTYCSRCVWS